MNIKPLKKPIIAIDGHPNTWFSSAQMSREAVRELLDYRDGGLYWREAEGRRRPEAGGRFYRKRIDIGPIWTIQIGPRANVTRYMRRYLVWNWHFGVTDRVLLPINGDTMDDRVENIEPGSPLSELDPTIDEMKRLPAVDPIRAQLVEALRAADDDMSLIYQRIEDCQIRRAQETALAGRVQRRAALAAAEAFNRQEPRL